ncbi:MAG: acyl-CoA thioesterase [Polyangiaceae bacterium]|nr:acyl-CoA thioesterase [Polyangiaceae bacterium]
MQRLKFDEIKNASVVDNAQLRFDLRVGMGVVDAAKIVYFSRFFEFFHQAYEELLGHAGLSLGKVLAQGQWIAPLSHAEADYLRPISLGEQVVVRIVAARCEPHVLSPNQGGELAIGYRVENAQGAICCVGSTVHVFLEKSTMQRFPLPEALLLALEPVIIDV